MQLRAGRLGDGTGGQPGHQVDPAVVSGAWRVAKYGASLPVSVLLHSVQVSETGVAGGCVTRPRVRTHVHRSIVILRTSIWMILSQYIKEVG